MRSSAPPPSSASSATRPATSGSGVASYGGISWVQAFTAEFVGTFILVFTIFGVIHRKAAAGFAGVAIGLVVFAAIIPVAPATGASINPARTVGPMLVQQIAGGTVKWEQLPGLPGRRAPRRRRSPRSPTASSPARRPTDAAAPGIDLADPRTPPAASRLGLTARRPPRETVMKKLINDPNDVVVEALLGIEAAHPELRVDHAQQDHLPRRRAEAGQGRHHLRRRLGPRAAARRVRRPGHARRGLRR